MARVLEPRHRHLGDQEQPVRADQHAVGPGEPGARHVDHDVVEMRCHQIEQPRHHLEIERAHLGRAARRRDHLQAGGVLRHHHLEQLPVEPVRPRLDLVEVEARFEVEIVGSTSHAGNRDRPGRSRLVPVLALEQQHRGLDRERGQADAAGRRQEGVDLRLGRAAASARPARRARRRAPDRPAATGFTTKSATRICRSWRASDTSNDGIATITGGTPPSRRVSPLSAERSASLAGVDIDDRRRLRRSVSSLRTSFAKIPLTTVSSTLPSMPNVGAPGARSRRRGIAPRRASWPVRGLALRTSMSRRVTFGAGAHQHRLVIVTCTRSFPVPLPAA